MRYRKLNTVLFILAASIPVYAQMVLEIGSTDVTTCFVLRGTDDGIEESGLTVTDFDLQYVRNRETPSAKVDASALGSIDAAHADNSAYEVDATDAPGLYRIDWPDAAFAAGGNYVAGEPFWVVLTVKCTGVFTEHLLVLIDPKVDLTDDAVDDDSFRDGVIDVGKFASGAITAALIATDAIGADELAADGVNEVRDSLVDDATQIDASALNTLSSHDPGDTIGTSTLTASDVWTEADRTLTALDEDDTTIDLDGTTIGTVSTLTGHTAQTADHTANITSILGDTNELQGDWTDAGRLDALVDTILADTNELQTDWTDGGRLDTILDGIGGGGGDATLANQTTMITHLTDIKGTGFVKDTHSLVQCITLSEVDFRTYAWSALLTDYQLTGSFGKTINDILEIVQAR